MNRKNIVLVTLTLLLVWVAGTGTILRTGNLLPRVSSANAITCPTGGTPTNGCLTVSLDAISRPTPGGGPTLNCQTPTAPASQPGVCDILINTSASNVTTFRIGAILNATTGSPATSNINCGLTGQIACGVFGFQYAINYDPTIVTPVGDPSSFCNSYPDCGEPPIWYGSQTVAGGVNWYSLITSSTQPTSISENGHTGKITVGFGFLAPLTPKVTTTKTVLASVAFAEVSPGTATFSISDVIFGDQNGVTIPGITGAPTTSCTLASCGMLSVTLPNTPPHASFTSSHTGTSYTFTSSSTAGTNPIANYVWDFGDKSPIVTGATATSVTHDYGLSGARTAPGSFTVTLRVADNKGLTSAARNKAGNPIFPYPPGGTGAPEQAFVNQGIVELGASPSFTFNPATPTAGQTVSFDASASTYPDEPLLAGTAPVGGTALTSTAAGDSACNLTIGLPCPLGFVDNNANGIFDPGVDIVVRDNTGLGTCTFGSCDVLAGPSIPLTGQTVLPDGKISWDDINADGSVNPGEPLIYDTNGNTLYDGIKSYHWDFGDGSAAVTTIIPTTSHTFANASPAAGYPVKLIVTDNPALTSSITNNVVVLGGPHTTTTSVSCSPSTITTSETSTCTVTVTDNLATGATTPTGTVALSTGATGAAGTFTPCALASTGTAGQAQCTSTFTPSTTGTASIRATYNPTSAHTTSQGATSVTVNPAVHSTITTVVCTPNAGAPTQVVSCTATVADTSTSPTPPTGTITWTHTGTGTFNVGTCTLNGGTPSTCSVTYTPNAIGAHDISASYGGDPQHSTSSTTTPVTITVTLDPTTTTLVCTPLATAPNQAVSCTATVTDTVTGRTPVNPTGTITWTHIGSGNFNVGTCTLNGGTPSTCTVTYTPTAAGSHDISASYGGDPIHATSSSTTSSTIVVTLDPTTTTIVCTPTAVAPTQVVSCTATVTDTITGRSPINPTGTVNWSHTGTGNFNVGTCTLNGGTPSTCGVSYTPGTTGSHDISASYVPDPQHAASTTATPFSITVIPPTVHSTTTTISCNPSSVVVGQSSTCTATVTDTSATGATIPTGMVTFTPGGSCSLQTATAPSATCSVTITPINLAVTLLPVTASYAGDSSHSGSTSNTFSLTVTARSTTTSITCVPSPVNTGSPTICTVSVTDTDVGGFIPPLGQVTVSSSGTGTFNLSPCNLTGTGVTTSCQVTYTPGGTAPRTDTLTATYAPATTHLASTGTLQLSVTQNLVPPTASFTESATSVLVGDTISFDASGSSATGGTIVSYTWDFGDGSTAVTLSTPTASHKYTSISPTCVVPSCAGFGVTLTVTDSHGGTGTASARKVVSPHPMIARFTESSTTASVGETINFDASTSSSPDVPIGVYHWDFGDGSPGIAINTATTSHIYTTPSPAGGFTVTLFVTDGSGTFGGPPTTAVKVINPTQSPTLSFTEDKTTAFRGQSITLTITTVAGTGTISSVKVDWGDSTIDTLLGTATSDSHAYTSLGPFTVTVTVTDSNSLTASSTATKLIINQLPTVSFTEDLTTAPTGTPITLNIKAADPDGTVQSITVNWGDNTAIDTLPGTATTDAHTYAKAGSYTVTVTATDNDGGKTTAPTATKTLTDRAPTASFTFTPLNPTVGQTISFDGTTSNDPDGTITTYAWNFGDTTISTGATTTHAYTAGGSYTVTLTVTDDAGLTGTTSATVQVTQQVTNPGHAKLIQWRADAKFNPDNLRHSPTQVLRAFGLNDGTVTVNVYVQFIITNPDGTTSTIYTKIVTLTPGQSINGRLDNRFTASFTTLPGRTNVTATIFYSADLSTPIGDVSFTPHTASAKTFSFNALSVRTDDFNFEDDITSASQSFDVSIQNVANIDLISRIDITIRQPERTTTSYVSGGLLLQSGQNGEIKFILPLTGPDGTYCFTATVKYGIDTNHNGQLDNNEILGTSGRQHECFSADTDDAPAGSITAPPMTIAHLSTDDD